MYCDKVLYKWNGPPSEKWRLFEKLWPSHPERFICCTLTIQYITYSTVGRSIASISNLGGIFPSEFCASVHMAPRSDISAIDLPTILYIIHIRITKMKPYDYLKLKQYRGTFGAPKSITRSSRSLQSVDLWTSYDNST